VLEIHSPYGAAFGCLTARRDLFGIRTFQWHSDFIDTYTGALLESPAAARVRPVIDRPVRIGGRALWGMVRAIGRRCDATFAASRGQAEKLARHGVPRVRHVPFGVERDVFLPARRDARVREALLAGRPGPLVVAIGRFAVEKRWDVVLDAFLRFRSRNPGVLVLLGDGPERARMAARVHGRDDVTFSGFVRDRIDLATILASADALLHGCPFETFGLSVAEALASGLPCVVPDEGGAAELSDGDGCVAYPALDAAAAAATLAALLARDAREVREAAARRGARLPGVEEQVRTQVAIYEELLDGRRHANTRIR
jgi:alpha-1,6-mannosyltransferase